MLRSRRCGIAAVLREVQPKMAIHPSLRGNRDRLGRGCRHRDPMVGFLMPPAMRVGTYLQRPLIKRR